MNVLASGAFKCSDVKAGRARRDPRQHRYRFAFRTWWSVKRAHDVVPYIRREHKNSQSPVDAVMGGDRASMELLVSFCWSVLISHIEFLIKRLPINRQSLTPAYRAERHSTANCGHESCHCS